MKSRQSEISSIKDAEDFVVFVEIIQKLESHSFALEVWEN